MAEKRANASQAKVIDALSPNSLIPEHVTASVNRELRDVPLNPLLNWFTSSGRLSIYPE